MALAPPGNQPDSADYPDRAVYPSPRGLRRCLALAVLRRSANRWLRFGCTGQIRPNRWSVETLSANQVLSVRRIVVGAVVAAERYELLDRMRQDPEPEVPTMP